MVPYWLSFVLFIIITSLFCITSASEKPLKYKGRYSRHVSDYDLVIPRRVSATGEFISHLLPRHFKRSFYGKQQPWELKDSDKLHYVIPVTGGQNMHVELWPDKEFVSPGMVVEIRGGDDEYTIVNGSLHKKERRFDDPLSKRVKIKRAKDVSCHYKGRVRGQKDSRVALSTCYGLAGHIRSKRGYYIIEPVEGHDPFEGLEHPHLLYKHDLRGFNPGLVGKRSLEENCKVKGSIMAENFTRKTRDCKNRKVLFENGTEFYIETLLVLDKSVLDYHIEFDVENYIFTAFSMAADLFRDASLDVYIHLVLVRIIRLEQKEDELNLALNKNAEKTLDAFRKWQQKMNPGDDTHPNHHDTAVLLTRVNICDNDNTCGLLGIAKMAGTCDPAMQASICQDVGLRLGYVIAHQIGHTLGIPHDSPALSGCESTFPDGSTTIMSPSITYHTHQWSKCSSKFLKIYFQSAFGRCLEDEPTDHNFDLIDVLPGVSYGGDFQCKQLFDEESSLCDTGVTCESLECYVENYGCIDTNMPPAPGTSCGDNKWCYDDKCLALGERPGAVSGGWGLWGPWSTCSRTCGSGIAYSERECNNPRPTNGGQFCRGLSKRHRVCSTEPCDIGQPSFRDVQCAEFDEWVYPEDGKTHAWQAYHMGSENPCVLFCINEQGVVAALKPKVIDGTTCYHGIRDVCIGGVCKEIPCDLKMESDAIEDVCGVCHGGGTECNLVEGKQHYVKSRGCNLLINIKKGSRNIRIEETIPSRSVIMVKDKTGDKDYVDGKTLGMFAVAGSRAWLGMIRDEQETLNIPGPILEDISIWIAAKDNVTIKYSLGTPLESKQKREPSYRWDIVDWTPCSAQCGPGEQEAVTRCVELIAGIVEDQYCHRNKTNTKFDPGPINHVRLCEEAPCIPRKTYERMSFHTWMIGDWQQECIHSKRSRAVKCVKPTGQGEGEIEILSDCNCQGTKPTESLKCNEKLFTTTESADMFNVKREVLAITPAGENVIMNKRSPESNHSDNECSARNSSTGVKNTQKPPINFNFDALLTMPTPPYPIANKTGNANISNNNNQSSENDVFDDFKMCGNETSTEIVVIPTEPHGDEKNEIPQHEKTKKIKKMSKYKKRSKRNDEEVNIPPSVLARLSKTINNDFNTQNSFVRKVLRRQAEQTTKKCNVEITDDIPSYTAPVTTTVLPPPVTNTALRAGNGDDENLYSPSLVPTHENNPRERSSPLGHRHHSSVPESRLASKSVTKLNKNTRHKKGINDDANLISELIPILPTHDDYETRRIDRQHDDSAAQYEKTLKALRKQRSLKFEVNYLLHQLHRRKRRYNKVYERLKRRCKASEKGTFFERGDNIKDVINPADIKLTIHVDHSDDTGNKKPPSILPADAYNRSSLLFEGVKALKVISAIQNNRKKNHI